MRTVLGVPGKVTVRGRDFVVPPPTVGDEARVLERMRELARAACVSPLEYVNANAGKLSGGVLAEALRAAVAMGSGGGVEPTREAVLREYDSLAGVRFRLWYAARKTEPGLTQAEVEAAVTDDDRFDVADALNAALYPQGSDGPKPEPGGAS